MGDTGAFILALMLLPLFFVLLVILGTVLFYHGKRYMSEPRHSVRIAIEAFTFLAKQRKARMQKLKRETPSQSVAPEDGKTNLLTEKMVDEEGIRLPAEDYDALPQDAPTSIRKTGDLPVFERFPIHDAPLWIFSFIIILIGYIICITVDITVRPAQAGAYWLEMLILGNMPLIRHIIPLPRPMIALIFYLLFNYALLLLCGAILARVLQMNTLHLLTKEHFLRKATLWMWRVCGFIDYRKLDRSIRIWLIYPTLILGCLIIAVDLFGYFQRLEVWAGGLAMIHLFFISLVRVFDETWMYPVKFEHQPHKVHRKTSLNSLAENVFRSGALKNVPVFLLEITPQKASLSDVPVIEIPPLTKDFLQGMTGGEQLWEHQAVGWKKIFTDRASAILCGPHGSGKRTWARLIAVNEVISLSGGVLYVLPDRRRLEEEVAVMRQAIANSGLRFNLAVFDASSPEFLSLDVAKHLPLLVLADPDSIGNVFLKHWGQFSNFWRMLSRVIVSDISQLNSIRASNFYYLLRRLLVIRDCENSRPIQICGTCSRISKAIENEIEELLGASMSFITADAAPAVPIRLYGIQSTAADEKNGTPDAFTPGASGREEHFKLIRPASLATMLGAGIRKEGFNVYYDPCIISRHELEREHTLGSWSPIVGPNPNPLEAATSILFVDQHNLFEIMESIRHYGATAGEGSHVCFLLFSHNPVVQYFLLNSDKLMPGSQQRTYGSFTFNPNNLLLQERHIEEALNSMPMSLSQLSAVFGKEIVYTVLADMIRDEWVEEIRQPEHPSAGCFILRNRHFPEDIDADTVVSRPMEVVDLSQNLRSVVLKGEPACIQSRYYPGRVFMHDGERYVVRRIQTGETGTAIVEVNACENDVLTTKIRSLDIDFKETDFKASSAICAVSGGNAFQIGVVRATICERIHGYMTWGANLKPVSIFLYGDQGHNDVVLSTENDVFLISLENNLPERDVLELIVNLWTAFVPSLLFGASDNIDIFLHETTAQDGSKLSYIAIRELYPGGVGILEKHDERQIMSYFSLARDMIKTLPDIGLFLGPFGFRETLLNVNDDLREKTTAFIDTIIPADYSALKELNADRDAEKASGTTTCFTAIPSYEGLPDYCVASLQAAIKIMEEVKNGITRDPHSGGNPDI